MRDSLKLELEYMRAQYQEDVTQLEDQLCSARTQCNQLICERRLLITKAQLIDEDLEAVEKMRDSLKLELEYLRAQYQENVAQLEEQLRNQCNQFICERRVLITRAQLIDEDLEAVKKMRVFMYLEIENLRAQYQEDFVQLEDQLGNIGSQRDHFTDKQDVLISGA
jgi:DNA-directed RNA polymerase subunit N (RpoN/RPB10)